MFLLLDAPKPHTFPFRGVCVCLCVCVFLAVREHLRMLRCCVFRRFHEAWSRPVTLCDVDVRFGTNLTCFEDDVTLTVGLEVSHDEFKDPPSVDPLAKGLFGTHWMGLMSQIILFARVFNLKWMAEIHGTSSTSPRPLCSRPLST